ncbi:hypothetical protein ABZ890_41985 [Streptomyces sp. NPDC046984]|uniref:hypothetical protein n=1 Tax=Streptomyces sp. NPDC046984 TaxID=3155138 RepID=UPI0033DC70BD
MPNADLDDPFAELPDRTVLLALEEVAHTLSGRYPTPIASPSEAREVLKALFEAADAPAPTAAGDATVARRVLAAFAREEESAELVGEVLADPPEDDQMGGEDLTTDLVVLAGVIAFLRLHVDFRFKRANGRSTIEFRLGQKPISDGLLTSLVRIVLNLLRRDGQAP